MVRAPPSAQLPPAVAEPVGDYSRVDSADYPRLPTPIPFSQALDNPEPPMANASTIVSPSPSAPPSDPVGKSLLRVQVPPGTAPGSTIHVAIPGENRMIAAQVPPNCTEFHVQYEPRVPQKPTPIVVSQESRNTHISHSPPGQKLLLVRVPAGSTTGTTLHVQVPNEPGRVLQAQVPPGQVKEFHVSYQPRAQGDMQSQQQSQQQQSHPFNRNNNNNQRQNNNGGRGSAVLPIVGGLATGAAAAMVYSHFAHPNDGQNYQDQGDYNDGGDYGGGDTDYGGGDMDFGGDF
jgi:hypothetical protein